MSAAALAVSLKASLATLLASATALPTSILPNRSMNSDGVIADRSRPFHRLDPFQSLEIKFDTAFQSFESGFEPSSICVAASGAVPTLDVAPIGARLALMRSTKL